MEFMKRSELGHILKETRRSKKLTLKEVADYTNCSVIYVHRMENSVKPNLNPTILRKLAELYELDLNNLQVQANPIDSSQDVKNHFKQVESFLSHQDTPAMVQAALTVVATALNTVNQ